MRAALSRPDAVDSPGEGLRLIAALLLPWWPHDRCQEARHWVDTHLASSAGAPAVTIAKAEAWCGLLADSTGWIDRSGGIEHEFALAAERQRRALSTYEQLGDDASAAYCRLLLAYNILRRNLAGMDAEVDEIDDHIAGAIAAFEQHDDDFGAALAHITLALGHVTAGRLAQAERSAAAADRHATRSGERFSRARASR